MKRENVFLSEELNFYKEYLRKVNGPGVFIPPCEHKYLYLSTADPENRPRFFNRNLFVIDSMNIIGGGAIPQLKRYLKHRRLGGSTQDRINYISKYRNYSDPSFAFKVPINDLMCRAFGSSERLRIMPPSEVINRMKVNYAATPGIFFKDLGFASKGETLLLSIFVLKYLYASTFDDLENRKGPVPSRPSKSTLKGKGFGKVSRGFDTLREVWTVASRPKLVKLEEKIFKIREGNPCCRGISVGGSLEQMVSSILYYSIEAMVKKNFRDRKMGIAIGINRLGEDWALTKEQFANYDYGLVCDYSKFDQTIPPSLLNRLRDFIIESFYNETPLERELLSKYKAFFNSNIVNKLYTVDNDHFFEVKCGLPSGTLWTSIGGSLINLIIIEEFKKEISKEDIDYLIYGDDHILFFNSEDDPEILKRKYLKFVKDKFGMEIDEAGSYISRKADFFVTYKRPVFDPKDIECSPGQSTSNLTPRRFEFSRHPFEKFSLKDGTTHRWSYVFGRRLKFLQYYWTETGASIRPLSESLIRIINPENPVKTVADAKYLVISHLFDNFDNAHMRNWAYHILYDLDLQDRSFGSNSDLSGKWFEYLKDRYLKKRRGLIGTGPSLSLEDTSSPRGWYRRLSEWVDLSTSPRMASFNIFFSDILKAGELIRSCSFDVPFYAVSGILRESLIRGNFRDNEKFLNTDEFSRAVEADKSSAFKLRADGSSLLSSKINQLLSSIKSASNSPLGSLFLLTSFLLSGNFISTRRLITSRKLKEASNFFSTCFKTLSRKLRHLFFNNLIDPPISARFLLALTKFSLTKYSV